MREAPGVHVLDEYQIDFGYVKLDMSYDKQLCLCTVQFKGLE